MVAFMTWNLMLIFILAFFITPEAAPADRSVKVENAVGKAQGWWICSWYAFLNEILYTRII